MASEKIIIDCFECYDYAVLRGYEPLTDSRFKVVEPFKRHLIEHKFGSGNSIEQNEKFFRWIWEHKPHYCEECMKPLRQYSAVYCSHILTRGAHPEFAYYPENINILCFEHHSIWENGNRRNMRIYRANLLVIEQLKKEYGTRKF